MERVCRIDVNHAHEGEQLRDEHEALKKPVADSRREKDAPLQWTATESQTSKKKDILKFLKS